MAKTTDSTESEATHEYSFPDLGVSGIKAKDAEAAEKIARKKVDEPKEDEPKQDDKQ